MHALEIGFRMFSLGAALSFAGLAILIAKWPYSKLALKMILSGVILALIGIFVWR